MALDFVDKFNTFGESMEIACQCFGESGEGGVMIWDCLGGVGLSREREREKLNRSSNRESCFCDQIKERICMILTK